MQRQTNRIQSVRDLLIAEFDAMCFRLTKGAIRAVFVEAKLGITRKSEKSRDALEGALKQALRTAAGGTAIRRKGLAYAEFPLE